MPKLGEICKIESGGTPSRAKLEYWDGGNIPWIKISNMNSKFVENCDEFITQEGLTNSSAKIFPKGTILISIFATLGEVSILKFPATTNQAIAGLQVLDNTVNTEYLYYFLKSIKTKIESIGRGVAQNNINLSILRKLDVFVPSKDEQEKIVSVMNLVHSNMSKLQKQLDDYDLLIKSRFIEMFGDPVRNDRQWRQSFLKDVTSKIGSGATPKGGKSSYLREGISFIRSMNVHDGKFVYKELAYLDTSQATALDNVCVEPYDVFVNITGASVARSCVVPKDVLPARVNQHVAIIRPLKSEINAFFLNHQFLCKPFKNYLLALGGAGGATREAITKAQLEQTKIVVPPLDLQNQFADFVAQVDKSKLAVQKSIDELETLKKSLMQEYFG